PTAAEVEQLLGELAGRGAGSSVAEALSAEIRPTVGRQQERALLWEGFESAAAGRGLLLCITGEPGTRKPALIEDMLQRLALTGRPQCMARGRGTEGLAGAEAYLPILEALDSLVRGAAGESAARAMRLLAPGWYDRVAPSSTRDAGRAPAAPQPLATQEQLK